MQTPLMSARPDDLAAMPRRTVPTASEVAATAAQLLASSSAELSTSDREAVARAARLLPAGMNVYVPKLPRRAHADAVDRLRLLAEMGFRPVPHIAARDLASTAELEAYLHVATRECGSERVLVIGGDADVPQGPFADSAAVIASGALEATGVRHVDVAGYPDGHPKIGGDTLRSDLRRKRDLAAQSGLGLSVITQFSFHPERIADYCVELAEYAPGIPVLAGVAGPTSATRLLHYAKICGVSTSLRAINKLGLDAVRLLTHADPSGQLQILARRLAAGTAGGLAALHLFTFGGFVESAGWHRSQADRGPR